MFDLGLLEILVIGVIALVVVGPERMPHAVRTLGRTYGKLRRAAEELRRALVLEADRMDEEERLKALRRKREEAARERAAMVEQGAVAQPANPPPDADAAESSDPLPPGFTAEEWDELPGHVKDIVRRRRSM